MKLYLQRVWALSASLVGQDDSSIQISCWTTIANEIYHFFESERPFQNCLRSEEIIAYILLQKPKDRRTNVAWFHNSGRFFLMIFSLQNLT